MRRKETEENKLFKVEKVMWQRTVGLLAELFILTVFGLWKKLLETTRSISSSGEPA